MGQEAEGSFAVFLFVFVLRICLAHSSLLIFYVQPDNAWPDIHAIPCHTYMYICTGIAWDLLAACLRF